MKALYSSFTTLQVIFWLPCSVLMVLLFDFISQILGVLIMNIKDFLKFLFFFNITIIISFHYSPPDISVLSGVDLCLTQDFFQYPEADFRCVEGLVYVNVVWEVYYNCSSVNCKHWI